MSAMRWKSQPALSMNIVLWFTAKNVRLCFQKNVMEQNILVKLSQSTNLFSDLVKLLDLLTSVFRMPSQTLLHCFLTRDYECKGFYFMLAKLVVHYQYN